MATLYLVATPIGNIEDITLRALRVLGEVDLIAAEDTRITRKLLSHYDIHTRTTSYHEHNRASKTPALLAALGRGEGRCAGLRCRDPGGQRSGRRPRPCGTGPGLSSRLRAGTFSDYGSPGGVRDSR